MDWDGVGTFAMFISTGAVGVCLIAFRAYKATLSAKLEMARLRSDGVPDETQEQIRDLEEQVRRLTDRVDFNEKLLSGGTAPPEED